MRLGTADVCIGHCGGGAGLWTPIITAAAVLFSVALTYWLGTRRERDREQRAAAWLLHEELWSAQSTIARCLHDISGESAGSSLSPGRWWTAIEEPRLTVDAEFLGRVALTLSSRKRQESHWRWVANARARVLQSNIEAALARAAQATDGGRPADQVLAPLRGTDPERLAVTYLRLDVARWALSAAGVTWRPHDFGWSVSPDTRKADEATMRAAGYAGPLDRINAARRLHGAYLVPRNAFNEEPETAVAGDPVRDSPPAWRDDVLTTDPTMTRLVTAYPWRRPE
jgi:hypothetical protein